ncbi:hypothetical protein SDC9_206037 [bioreactor metagenome]|uniref:Uncharacterized protein n=1 Tax=bioreactor metagenome TaxID=1076179 RepID=A0A645JFF7_9ZZZZ
MNHQGREEQRRGAVSGNTQSEQRNERTADHAVVCRRYRGQALRVALSKGIRVFVGTPCEVVAKPCGNRRSSGGNDADQCSDDRAAKRFD